VTPDAVARWAVLLIITGSLMAIAVGLGVLALWFRRHSQDMRDFTRAAVEHTKVASDRAAGAQHLAEKVEEKVDKLSEQVAGDTATLPSLTVPPSGRHVPPPPRPPAPPPAPPPLLWWIVPAMIVSAAGMCAAAVMHTSREGERMTTPVNPTAARQYDRAVTAQRAMKFGEALAAYRAAAAAGYDPCLALFGVAECAFYLKQDDACRAACQDLLKCDGGAGRARFWLAHLHRRAGKEDLARQEWEQSFKEGFALAGMILAGSPHRPGGANNG
jgi:hypothetical protein